jgi:hypothetical protein
MATHGGLSLNFYIGSQVTHVVVTNLTHQQVRLSLSFCISLSLSVSCALVKP